MVSESLGEHAMSMETESGTVERSIEHTTSRDGELLDTLSEEQEDRVQMEELYRRTQEDGSMQLKCSTVTTAENSPQFAIEVEHPVEGTIRLFAEKPVDGWSDDYLLVRMFDWYDVTSNNPHELQLRDLYVKKDEESSDYAHGWTFVRPPDYSEPEPPVREQLADRWATIKNYRPDRSNGLMYTFLFAGAVIGPVLGLSLPALLGPLTVPAVTMVVFMFTTIMGMVVLDK